MPEAFRYLLKNIELNNLTNIIEARNIAIGGKTGYTVLYSYKDIMLTKAKIGKPMMVPTISLSKLIYELVSQGMKHILLKMDCEGCEHEALYDAARSGALSYIDRLIVEIHDHAKQLLKLLTSYGYKVKVIKYDKVRSSEVVLIKGARKLKSK